jgi:nicotinate-nucleotide pyrophosphorylase (carboxylating)
MLPEYINTDSLDEFIENAFAEDVGDGDHSSLASIPRGAKNKAYFLMKESGIIAGVTLCKMILNRVEPTILFEAFVEDGDNVNKGDIIINIEGNSRAILMCERLILNCMQRMSGIATYTHRLNKLIEVTNAQLLDTRKTTPNFRMMEKWAVLIGGGVNHRYGLFDMIMLKDNHIDFAGGINKAVKSTQEYLKLSGKNLKVEVETRSLDEVKEAIETKAVDRIMLDNMEVDTMTQAVQLINGRSETEASGGITEDTIHAVALTGVDYISVGALTHSVKSIDISLKSVE